MHKPESTASELLTAAATGPSSLLIVERARRKTAGSPKMAEKGDSSEEEPTIAEDVVVTKYKMAGDMANRKG